MRQITPTEHEAIRDQSTVSPKRYLAFGSKRVVVRCQTSADPESDAENFGYTALNLESFSVGDTASAVPGQSIYVGTEVGAHDVAILRVRKVSGDPNRIYINNVSKGESNILSGQTYFVDVVEEYLPWHRLPFLQPVYEGENIVDFEVFIDYDVVYTDQNEDIEPKANITGPLDSSGEFYLDPVLFGFVDPDTSYRDVVLSAATSLPIDLGQTITGYLWDVGDGTIIDGDDESEQITVRFSSSLEFRYISLAVASSNGKTHTVRFPMWSVERDSELVFADFTVERDDTSDGRAMVFSIFDDGTTREVDDVGVVAYFEDYEDRENLSFHRNHFFGWIMNKDIVFKYGDESRVELHVGGPTEAMKVINGADHALVYESTPFKWFHMNDISPTRAVHFTLRSTSTFMEICNFFTQEENERTVVGLNIDEQNLAGQISKIADKCAQTAKSDSCLGIRLAKQPETMQDDDYDAIVATIILDERDVPDDSPIAVKKKSYPTYSFVYGGGDTERNSEKSIYASRAPGRVRTSGTQDSESTFQILPIDIPQARLNRVVGGVWGMMNSPYESVEIKLLHDIDVFDVSRNPCVLLSTSEQALEGSIAFHLAVVERVSINHDSDQSGAKQISLRLRIVNRAEPGEMVEVPGDNNSLDDEPPVEEDEDDEFDTGIRRYPGHDTPIRLAFIDENGYLYRTWDLTLEDPVWARFDLLGIDFSNGYDFDVDPNSPHYLETGTEVACWFANETGIYYVDDVFAVTPTVTLQKTVRTLTELEAFPNTNLKDRRIIRASRVNPGHVYCFTVYKKGSINAEAIAFNYTVDGENWSDEVEISDASTSFTMFGSTPVVLPTEDDRIYWIKYQGAKDFNPAAGFCFQPYGTLHYSDDMCENHESAYAIMPIDPSVSLGAYFPVNINSGYWFGGKVVEPYSTCESPLHFYRLLGGIAYEKELPVDLTVLWRYPRVFWFRRSTPSAIAFPGLKVSFDGGSSFIDRGGMAGTAILRIDGEGNGIVTVGPGGVYFTVDMGLTVIDKIGNLVDDFSTGTRRLGIVKNLLGG